MQIIRSDEGTPRDGTTFTGKATLTSMLGAQLNEGMRLTIVEFEDGAVTNWHDHPGEQILYILEGRCRAGNSEEQWELGPGEIIYVGPGEKHWHGAVEGQFMSHISVTTVGPPTWYDEAPF